MKPHPRPPCIRKTIKWGGLAATVLLAAVWIGSAWIGGGWCSSRGDWVWVSDGALMATQQSIANFPSKYVGWHAVRGRDDFVWWFHFKPTPTRALVAIPLWMVLLPCAAGAAFAWRLDALARRRARLGQCPKCRYDRTGLAPGAICPECGAAAPHAPPAS